MNNTKICSKCGRELPIECFSKCKLTKDGFQYHCKECNKQYGVKYRAEHKEEKKQYYQAHREEMLEQKKQYYAEHPEKQKQYYTKRYSTLEGYAYAIRYRNLQTDREHGRVGKDEDPLPPLEYYIEKFSEGIDFYDEKKYSFNELGFDRIDDSKPHTIGNIVVATTEHNKDRWKKRMTVEKFRELIQLEKMLREPTS